MEHQHFQWVKTTIITINHHFFIPSRSGCFCHSHSTGYRWYLLRSIDPHQALFNTLRARGAYEFQLMVAMLHHYDFLHQFTAKFYFAMEPYCCRVNLQAYIPLKLLLWKNLEHSHWLRGPFFWSPVITLFAIGTTGDFTAVKTASGACNSSHLQFLSEIQSDPYVFSAYLEKWSGWSFD